MNNTNLSKKWVVLIAVLIMLFFSFKDFDFSQLAEMGFKDIVPIIVLTVFIFILRAGVFSVILLSIQKLWNKLSKKN